MILLIELLRAILGAVALIYLLYVPGAVILNTIARRRPAPHLFSGLSEWLFAAVFVSVLTTGGVGFLLAEIGLFHWWSVPAGVTVVALAATFVGQIPRDRKSLLALLRPQQPFPQRVGDRRMERAQSAALVALLVVAAALFSRPAEMLRGALDSGVYVNAGVALGRTGAFFQRDLLMRQLNDDRGEGRELLVGLNPDRYTLDRLRMPGFYVYDKQAAMVVPQHYMLYPVWIGLMYSLFGIWGALYATPLLALFGVCAVYFFARRAFSPVAALVAMMLLVLCPVTIWFARYPVAEVITQGLAFGAFFAFMRMVQLSANYELRITNYEDESDQEAKGLDTSEGTQTTWATFWGAVAGVALGQLALARPDFVFYVIPVPFFLLYRRLSRTWRPAYTWFAGALAVTLGIFLVHFFFYSYAYTMDLYYNKIQDVRRLWGPVLFLLYLGLLLLILLDRSHTRLRPLWRRASGWLERNRWVWAGALVLVVGIYAAYHYAVGPWLPNVRYDRADNPIPQAFQTTWESYTGAPTDQGERYNLLRIGWYLSPFGMVLGIAGLLRWVWGRLDAATGLFFGCLLVVGFIYIDESYTDAHYIYTMRRYVPVILPALLLGFAWACHFLWKRVRPRPLGMALSGVAVLGLALFFIYTSRAIIPHVEERGAVAQLSELASRFEGKSVVLFSNLRDEPYVVATPLHYIFGVPSFALARNYPEVNNNVLAGIIKRWQEQGYTVWVMMGANGGKLDIPGYTLREEGSWSYSVDEFEQLYYQKPSNPYRVNLPWGIYSLQPQTTGEEPERPFNLDIGEMDYKYLVAGFYNQEQPEGDSSSWRWTGDHAVLRVPWPTGQDGTTLQGGTITLRLRPESPVEGRDIQRRDPLTLTVSLETEDNPVGQISIPPGSAFADYTLEVPEGVPKSSAGEGTALLHIVAPTWSPQSAGISYDPRVLGVQVDAIEIEE